MTLIEILISTVVLALVFLGVLALFVSGRKYLQGNQLRMDAAELGKTVIDPLQMQVRQWRRDSSDQWVADWDQESNQLKISHRISANYSQPATGITYTATSDVYQVPNDSAGILRGVKTKITWNENQ